MGAGTAGDLPRGVCNRWFDSRALALWLAVVAVALVAAETTSGTPANGAIAGNITNWIKLRGDQVVVVPNGTYTAGPVLAPHPATTGPLKG